jgi:hypothetical protein
VHIRSLNPMVFFYNSALPDVMFVYVLNVFGLA